jgi:hypothetical protein
MVAFFGGCAFLTCAAIAGAFEAQPGAALLAALPWLVAATLSWAGVVWPDLRGRAHRGLVALAVGASWVAAVSFAAAGVVAFLVGVGLAFGASRVLLRGVAEEASAATMDAQT